MKTLTKQDLVGCNHPDFSWLIIFKMHELLSEKGIEIKSDFSGNLFYSYKENDCIHAKPLFLCIPELKNEHDEMKKDGE